MALHLNVSNSLSRLAEKLSLDLKNQQQEVFLPFYIVTQTEGMNNWLKLQIAGHLGIAANCKFLKPNDLINQLYYLLGGRFPNTLSSENLSWLLFKILGEKEFTSRFKTVADYYNQPGMDKDIKRLALAEKLADLFDQYQIYRPDMIAKWNAATDAISGYDWQQFLWIKAKQVSEDSLPDKTAIGKYILDALKNTEKQSLLAAKIPALHVFGLSITTVFHLQILQELGKYIDLSFHILNPAPAVYWFEDKSEKQIAAWRKKGYDITAANTGNALLTSWGRLTQDTFNLLFQNEEMLNAYNEIEVEEPPTDSLLHKIQHDIFHNNSNGERNTIYIKDIADGSITLNACYTIAREVEVLYNYLVHLVDKRKETLSPRDIVVMVTDIDTYSPYIKAVFDNAPYPFSYTIADESFTASDTILNALQTILAMNQDNFKAEEVLQLLDSSFIKKRFGLSNLPLIRKLVDRANIRFGMEGNGVDETKYVSWKNGLQRIMYGICMKGGDEYKIDDDTLFPLDALEGNDSLEMIRFSHFVMVLMDSIHEREKARTISEWVEYIEQVLHNLICEPDEAVDEDYNMLLHQLEKLNALNEMVNDKISFDVFHLSFSKSISGSARSGTFASGGITFCSLIPMRSIPFKVVALLGLNFDKFPRKETPTNFNLMELEKRKGDRNVKENDKHLFLETLVSAKQYLYISYLGQSPKDNTDIPPSALVDELIDYIESGCDDPEKLRALLITKQPLHGFSQKYSKADPRFYSYTNMERREEKIVIADDKINEPFSFEEITIDSLISFFKNPFKGYYNKALNIYYNDEQVLLSDTELFEMDSLQEWTLKQQLLRMDEKGSETLKRKLVKTGLLPLKNMADIEMQKLETVVDPVRKLFKQCTGNVEETILNVELSIDNSVLKGSLKNVFDDKIVFVSFSKRESKYLMDAAIRYLAARASGADIEVYFISAEKNKIYKGAILEKEEAMQKLKALVQLYKKGHEEIVAFYPDFEISPQEMEQFDFQKFQKIIHKKLDGYNFSGNDYIIKEYEKGYFEHEDILEAYKSNSEKILIPVAEIFTTYYE